MPDRIPVFDDWGNKIGDFIPEASGGGGAILLAFVAVFIFGFVFYAIHKLIATAVRSAIQDARKGKWGKVIQLICIALGIVAILSLAAISTYRDNVQRNMQTEKAWAYTNAAKVVSTIKTQDGISCDNLTNKQPCGEGLYNEYQLTNNLQYWSVYVGEETSEITVGGQCLVNGEEVRPGQTLSVMCKVQFNGKPVRPCFPITLQKIKLGYWCATAEQLK